MNTNETCGYSEAEIDAMAAEQPPDWLFKEIPNIAIAKAVMPVAERIATEQYDGHLTIYRFTTGWKAFFGTPDVWNEDFGAVSVRRTAPTLGAALADAIRAEPDGFIRLEFAIGKASIQGEAV